MAGAPTIRDESEGDFDAVAALLITAFGRHDEARLVDELRSDCAVVSLVAEKAGQIVGHVMLSALEAPMPALALAPLTVAQSHRRQGIAGHLVRTALSEARTRGWQADLVLGDPAYYERFGFDVDAARRYTCDYAGDHFMINVLGEPVPAHGRIAYPAAFGNLGK